MIRSSAATLVLAISLVPGVGFAQTQFEGLDLTQDPPKEEKKEEEIKDDFAAPTTPTPEPEPSPDVSKPTSSSGSTERDITQEDRVKSVQRKLYLKKYRFELSPSINATVNDPYYIKYGASIRAGYYLADTLALSGRFTLYQVAPSDDVRTAKRNFQSRIFYSEPQWSGMGNVEWSPIYGKVAIFNSILHFDAYVLGGLGVMNAATSSLQGRGLYAAGDLGFGMRFVTKDYLAVNVSLINTSYVEQPTGTTKAATQNIMALNVGLSLFLPLRSTARESE